MQTQFRTTGAFHDFLLANGVADDRDRTDGEYWTRIVKSTHELTDDLSLDDELEGISLDDWERWYDH